MQVPNCSPDKIEHIMTPDPDSGKKNFGQKAYDTSSKPLIIEDEF